MRNTTIVLAALLSLTTAALADDTQTAQQPAQQAAATPDKDKKVCRTMYHDGSLLRTHQCKTQREWDSLRTEQQRQVTTMQTSGYQAPH
jgi:hypothetical protein